MAHPSHASPQTSSQDYHGHPNYFAIWAILMAFLGVSLLLGYLGNKALAVSLIFGLAIVKALLVLGNFMHLRWEPRLVSAIIGFAALCMVFLYFGVMPDIVYVDLKVAQ